MKILVIIGTRPEAIKLLPLCLLLKENGAETTIVNTGQHKELLTPLWDIFNVQADYSLDVIEPNQSLSSLSARLILELDKVISRVDFDYIIVQGDTSSCMVGSLVGFYNKIKVVHVEAGLRTYNINSPFPEELNRRITSLVAEINFVPTELALQNLIKENVMGQIYVTGNTGVDALLFILNRVRKNDIKYKKKFKKYFLDKNILITGHRRENHGSRFDEIFSAINELAKENANLSFIYPVHFNPNVRQQALLLLSNVSNIHLIEPVDYDEMIYLMDQSYIIMTDSGGIQEEAPTLNKPVIILRDATERPEGVTAGCNVLAGFDKNSIKNCFNKILMDKDKYYEMAKVANPYGDGKASERIVKYLLKK